MRLGLGETTLLTTMHPDAKDYFEVNADLGKRYFGVWRIICGWILDFFVFIPLIKSNLND